uniref:Transposase n=1 Tax=Streptomyces sp. NBC_01401 TaxID=2903854 RepID=A0AAU3GWV6_9ACTN
MGRVGSCFDNAASEAFNSVLKVEYVYRQNAPRAPGWKTGASLGIAVNMRIRIGERNVTNKALSYTAYTALRTITRFCQPADRTIQRHPVPRLRGIEAEDLHAQLVDVVLPYA